ncbi:MAG: PBP1A family penicillin-binding protein [Acidobacteria bacterium]|nr:PBP1A family penicillin-binding protein [Acidobacteriota bacterium]
MANIKHAYSNWRQAPVRSAYQAATSRYVVGLFLIVLLVGIGVLALYYNRYMQIIDAGLRGDIFVRSSGIYAAPLNMQDGSPTRINLVMTHLKNIGYQERGTTENEKRGQFIVRGNSVEIYPGSETLIDGIRAYKNLKVSFGRDGSGIQSITDLGTNQRLDQAQIEPELISSVINQDREKRKIIDYKDLPQSLVNAIVVIEDRQFFEHPGINWRGILRALIRDYQVGSFREGGSSITQQLVKNFFLKPDKTLKRKLSEAYMSVLLEQRLSKQEIMAMYCNQIYLGQRGGFSINGFGQAARAYFGKDVSNLSLHESAMLAGIIRSPNYYSPYSNEERAKERRNLVIEKMAEATDISRSEADASKRLPLGITNKVGSVDASDAPYFIDFLMRQLESQYDENSQSLRSMRVYSTIDLELQRAAYQAVTKNMVEVEKLLARRKTGTAGLQAAMVALNPKTGEILAMVGGRDYAASQLNRATDAKRQPGSVFKPFVYGAALEQSTEVSSGQAITPATIFIDEPHTFEFDGRPYEPGNFGDKFEMRPMTVRDALVNSKNVITVEIAEKIGYQNVQRFAERAGLTRVQAYPSTALGVGEASPLQMAAAYTAFSNQGLRAAPFGIKRITTKDGVTVTESKIETREVMSPQIAYIMTSMMQDVINRGTGTRVRQMGFNGVAAGKTGSSRDGWFAGYTPNLVCVVWVGFDDNSDLGLTGGATAAPIWADFMIRALQLRPELGGDFIQPEEGIVTYDIDPATGALAQGDSPNVRHELFLRGTEPGGQPLPDSYNPDGGASPARSEIEPPRPTPTPRISGEDRSIAGQIDPTMIPLPPEARKNRPRPAAEPAPAAPKPDENPSFFRKLISAIGFSSTPKPRPTPWSSGGLGPAPAQRIGQENSQEGSLTDFVPLPPGANRSVIDESGLQPRPVTSASRSPVPVIKSPPKEPPRTASSARPRPIQESTGTTRPRRVEQDARKTIKTPTKPAPKPRVANVKPTPKPKVVAVRPTPVPAPVLRPAPVVQPVQPTAQPGTFVLEVCALSGLLPVNGVCNTRVKKRFTLGREPTAFCNESRHRGN